VHRLAGWLAPGELVAQDDLPASHVVPPTGIREGPGLGLAHLWLAFPEGLDRGRVIERTALPASRDVRVGHRAEQLRLVHLAVLRPATIARTASPDLGPQ
jgi:hypothetical protein